MRRLAPILAALASGAAGAQTMLDQEQRLIEIHSLLLDLPAAGAPGAPRSGELSVGLEVITVPPIDGTTGNKKQLTASDRTPVAPRPRVALGLPVPEPLRAFVGLAYVPPLVLGSVSLHLLGAEAGIAWAPGALRLGVRGHLLAAESLSPVTDPKLRDRLRTIVFGAEAAGGYELGFGALSATPYGGIGFSRLSGTFHVTSDAVELTSQYTSLVLHAGARLLWNQRWEGVVELVAYPGRMVHPNLRLSYLFGVF